jgi:hypothetical protein
VGRNAVRVAILRDAALRAAPQDEVILSDETRPFSTVFTVFGQL